PRAEDFRAQPRLRRQRDIQAELGGDETERLEPLFGGREVGSINPLCALQDVGRILSAGAFAEDERRLELEPAEGFELHREIVAALLVALLEKRRQDQDSEEAHHPGTYLSGLNSLRITRAATSSSSTISFSVVFS